MEIKISTVKVIQHVVLGTRYVLESSFDLITWVPVGTEFTAEEEELVNEFDAESYGRFYRLREVD